jgi:glycosyltransferase involved in cell wall biosynthesis
VKPAKLLIIGKMPPPIGGVTVHVERLCSSLSGIAFPYLFYSLSGKNILRIAIKILYSTLVHLHTSNPYARLFFALYCRALGKKIIITYHGDIGRFGCVANKIDLLSIILASTPIVLNRQSFNSAVILNGNTRLITAFIPPQKKNLKSDIKIDKLIKEFRRKYSVLFSTNAYNVSFDKYGNEIYGISNLVNRLV